MNASYNLVLKSVLNSNGEKKWYAVPASKGSLDENETATLAVQDTTLSKGEYKHAMEVSSEKLIPAVLRGVSVTIGSLGKLRLSFGSKGVDNIEDFNAQTMIQNAKFVFTPSKELKTALANATFELEGVVENGIKYGSMASYKLAKESSSSSSSGDTSSSTDGGTSDGGSSSTDGDV